MEKRTDRRGIIFDECSQEHPLKVEEFLHEIGKIVSTGLDKDLRDPYLELQLQYQEIKKQIDEFQKLKADLARQMETISGLRKPQSLEIQPSVLAKDEKLQEIKRREVVYAMINAEDNARKRISECLDDNVSQLLYGIKIQLDRLAKIVPAAKGVKEIKGLVEETIRETGNISFDLAPALLTDFGLPATIEELVKRYSSSELQMTVFMKGFHTRMDLLLETNIFRIVHELVSNSLKHSCCSEIKIEISRNELINILVKDNGRGYDVGALETPNFGSGLNSIKNRLRIYHGSMAIDSTIGEGTSVEIDMYEHPLPVE